jgi:hypothetical protein
VWRLSQFNSRHGVWWSCPSTRPKPSIIEGTTEGRTAGHIGEHITAAMGAMGAMAATAAMDIRRTPTAIPLPTVMGINRTGAWASALALVGGGGGDPLTSVANADGPPRPPKPVGRTTWAQPM